MDRMRVVVLLSIFGLTFVIAARNYSQSDETTKEIHPDSPIFPYRAGLDRIMVRIREIANSDNVHSKKTQMDLELMGMSMNSDSDFANFMAAYERKYIRAKLYEETIWIDNDMKILGDTIRHSTVIPVKAKEELVNRLIDINTKMFVSALFYRDHEKMNTEISGIIRAKFKEDLKNYQFIIDTMQEDLSFELQLPFEDRRLRVGLVLAMKRNKLSIDVTELALMTPEEASKYAVKIDAKDALLYEISIDAEEKTKHKRKLHYEL